MPPSPRPRFTKRFGIPFAHLAFTIRFQENGRVHPDRLFPPKRVVNVSVQREGWQPLRGPDGVRDLHQMVIHHHCQVIDRQAVRFDQDGVIQCGIFDRDVAPDRIGNGDGPFARHPEADDVRPAARNPLICFR